MTEGLEVLSTKASLFDLPRRKHLQPSLTCSSRLKSLSSGGKTEKGRWQTSYGKAKCTALVGRYRKANTMIKSSWSFHIRQCGRSHSSTTAATGVPMYTQKAGLVFGGGPTQDEPHRLSLCWVVCGGVL